MLAAVAASRLLATSEVQMGPFRSRVATSAKMGALGGIPVWSLLHFHVGNGQENVFFYNIYLIELIGGARRIGLE